MILFFLQDQKIASSPLKADPRKDSILTFEPASFIVVGHPGYYPKFGFTKASEWGIKVPFEVPDEVFMALEIVKGELQDKPGIIEYPAEFMEL